MTILALLPDPAVLGSIEGNDDAEIENFLAPGRPVKIGKTICAACGKEHRLYRMWRPVELDGQRLAAARRDAFAICDECHEAWLTGDWSGPGWPAIDTYDEEDEDDHDES